MVNFAVKKSFNVIKNNSQLSNTWNYWS